MKTFLRVFLIFGYLFFAASVWTAEAVIIPGCVQPPSGMVAWWSGDNNALDIMGNYDGTLVNGTYAAGMVGQAFSFDGTDDYVDLPDGFADFTSGFTVGLWANPTSTGYWARFIEFANGAANHNILLTRRSTSNDLAFEVYVAGSSTGMAYAVDAITNNEWHYYAATHDATGVKLYKDGVLLAQALDTGTPAIPDIVTRVNNYIGRSNWPGDAYYAGKMDEVAIFNRALTVGEIAAIYNAGSVGMCKQSVTVPSATGNGDIILETNTSGCGFSNVATKTEAEAAPGNEDASYDYPYGFVEFTLNCESADVTITFPGDISGTQYRKYGPVTPGDINTTAWYDFNGTIAGNQITLHLEDNTLGDDTGDDGIIVDQGGPGQLLHTIPTMNEWGMIIFIALAGFSSVYYIRRKRRA